MPRLVLIDAANALYRAFFALPPLRSPSGAPTGAVFGFANMLRKLVREEKPDAIAVAMDPRGGSFRRELFSGYKATRDAQPEDLTAQLPLARIGTPNDHVPTLLFLLSDAAAWVTGQTLILDGGGIVDFARG